MIDDCVVAAQYAGLRWCRPIQYGQNLVMEARWRKRRVIAKCRLATYRLRLCKERLWLKRAHDLGITVPGVVELLDDIDWLFLLLQPIRLGREHPHGIAGWAGLIAPLYQLDDSQPGWGPLRADDRPRWTREQQALDWYLGLAERLAGRQATELVDRLQQTWRHRERGLIHGDLHPGNRIGDHLLDWENVAVADPLEDACRLALATGYSPRSCIEAWGGDPSSPRAQGALLRSVIESAAHPGPRQAQAERLLAAMI